MRKSNAALSIEREKIKEPWRNCFFERALRWKLHWIRLKAGLLNQRRITKEGRTFEALQTEGPRIRCMQSHGTWQTHRRKLIEAQTSRCADRRSYQKRREIVLLWIHEGKRKRNTSTDDPWGIADLKRSNHREEWSVLAGAIEIRQIEWEGKKGESLTNPTTDRVRGPYETRIGCRTRNKWIEMNHNTADWS